MIGVPFIWVMTGLVLTEMPAILLMAASLYLLLRAQRDSQHSPVGGNLVAFIGGAALGMAFLSRASVLVILGAVPCLALDRERRALGSLAFYVVGAFLVAGPVIAIWGGLVPPHSAVAVGASSFSFYNLLLSFSYAATVMLILAPRWFDLPLRWMIGVLAAVFVVNTVARFIEIPVARSVLARAPAFVQAIAPSGAGSMMVGLAVLFAVCSVKHLYQHRRDPAWLFVCVAMLLLVASPGKITHQFSSRYTGMASGMMVLTADPYTPPTLGQVVRPIFGMLIGFASLLSYYALATH
jgi:hypothetical protein